MSLFSGIGAFEKALANLSIAYELVAFSEIDKFAAKSYALLYDESASKNLGDIRNIDTAMLPKDIDLLTYGFPCTSLSIAGAMKGFRNDDGSLTSSGLFIEALRIIEAVKPKIAIAENVKALVSKRFTNEFAFVLNSLENAGYNNYHKVLRAQEFGVPQNRERVFIVSIRQDIDRGFEFPTVNPVKCRLADVLEDDVPEKYYLSAKMVAGFRLKEQKRPDLGFKFKVTNPEDAAACIIATYGKCAAMNCYVAGCLNYFNYKKDDRVYSPDGLGPTLTTMQGGYSHPKILLEG